jgi:hypothetical protein
MDRQVVVGGKNKYLINGQAVQASQVQNLFHSVQLNVNNPHFLIMQGRITKVCADDAWLLTGMECISNASTPGINQSIHSIDPSFLLHRC